MEERSWKGKVVLVTGGGAGIGREIARHCLAAGARLTVLVDFDSKAGNEGAAELILKYGPGKAVFIPADVTNENDLDSVYEKLIKDYQQIDVLVNCAGTLDERQWKKCIDINLTYLIGWSLKYREHMRKDRGGKGGTIINIGSIYSFRVDQYIPVYQATKFGVMGFTRSLGHSYNYERTGVRVVAVCPSYTHTELTRRGFTDDFGEKESFEDLCNFLNTKALWQEVDAVGKAAVEIFERADSGTAWLIEGGQPITIIPEQ